MVDYYFHEIFYRLSDRHYPSGAPSVRLSLAVRKEKANYNFSYRAFLVLIASTFFSKE